MKQGTDGVEEDAVGMDAAVLDTAVSDSAALDAVRVSAGGMAFLEFVVAHALDGPVLCTTY
jgi:hypothetical protein